MTENVDYQLKCVVCRHPYADHFKSFDGKLKGCGRKYGGYEWSNPPQDASACLCKGFARRD